MATAAVDLLRRLQAEMRAEERPPEGYKTAAEYAEITGISGDRARSILKSAFDRGLVDRVSVKGKFYYREKK